MAIILYLLQEENRLQELRLLLTAEQRSVLCLMWCTLIQLFQQLHVVPIIINLLCHDLLLLMTLNFMPFYTQVEGTGAALGSYERGSHVNQSAASFPGSSPAFCHIPYSMRQRAGRRGDAVSGTHIIRGYGHPCGCHDVGHGGYVQYATKSWGGALEQG